jgi:hypothetical protein
VGLILIAAGVILAIVWRNNHREAFVDRGAPEDEPQGEVQFSGSEPKNAFHLEEGNVLARTAFSTPGPANSKIEIRDFKFPPHVRTRLGGLPGSGVLEVYSGQGPVSVAGASEELAGGVVKGVPAGQPLEFDNRGDHSLFVRIFVVEGQ